MNLSPFHLAIPVVDLDTSRRFYRDVLGCEEGRSAAHWVDFNFFGHQLVLHFQDRIENTMQSSNPVDGKEVPVPHFGVVLAWGDFEEFAERLRYHKVTFLIEPYTRFAGEVGEQATLFFKDPAGNALEFKAFKDMEQLFAK